MKVALFESEFANIHICKFRYITYVYEIRINYLKKINVLCA